MKGIKVPEGWRIVHKPLPAGRRGTCCWATKTITIDTSLDSRGKRFALLHETLHAVRGPVAPYNRGKEETAINRLAAKILIPLENLQKALAEQTNIWETADALDVEVEALQLRLKTLTSKEKKQLEKGKQNEQHQEAVL